MPSLERCIFEQVLYYFNLLIKTQQTDLGHSSSTHAVWRLFKLFALRIIRLQHAT